MIDENGTVQMVNFVLDTHSQQTFCFHGVLLTVKILIADANPLGTFDLVVNTGHR